MKTCFSTLACPDWSLSEILAAAVRYRYDGVELRVVSREFDLWKLLEFQASALSATRRAIVDHGLAVACLGSSACFHSSDPQERQRNFDSALRMAEVASGLGVPAIRVFGDRIQTGSNREQTTAWVADSLDRLADKLRSSNVRVWLETHGDFASASDVSMLLARTHDAEIGIIWDPANVFAERGDAPHIPPSLSGCIQHVHLKDLKRSDQPKCNYVATGEGEFPFDTMFEGLAAIHFNGFVSFEWEKQWHPELESAHIALPHFMRWWQSRVAGR